MAGFRQLTVYDRFTIASGADLFVAGGNPGQILALGTLSSSTAGSGIQLDATTTSAISVQCDDADTARAVGTTDRCITARFMVYAAGACENWGVDGLTKFGGVADTGNVSAGVVGRFESTGTCTTATGSGNTFCAGVMGRVGGGGTFTIGSGTYVCGVLSFYNTSTTNAFTNTGTCAFMATASDIAGTGNWDYGLYIEDTVYGIYCAPEPTATGRIAKFVASVAAPNLGDGYGFVEIDLTITGTQAGTFAATSTWINLGTDATINGYMSLRNDGIYDATATLTSANISMQKYSCLLAANPAWLSIWELNFQSTANNVIDAIFNVNDAARSLGYTTGTSGANLIGSVPFFSVGGGAVKYVYIYDAPPS